MGAAYSQDLRDRVLAACDRGMATKQIADLFTVSSAWVRRVKQRRRENSQVTPRAMGGLRVIKINMEQLRKLVEQTPDATVRELHLQLQSLYGVKCSESAVGMALGRLGFTFKKRQSMPQSRNDRMSKNAGSGGKANRQAGTPDV